MQPGRLGVFSGVKRSAGEDVAEPEIVINLVDVKKNEWSPWNDMVQNAEIFQQALLESFFLNDIFIPGVAAMVACSNKYSNFAMQTATVQVDSAGVHRARHPSAGSFSYYHNVVFQATKDIFPGEELAIPCSDDSDQPFQYSNRKVSSVDFLQESGMCVDVQEIRLFQVLDEAHLPNKRFIQAKLLPHLQLFTLTEVKWRLFSKHFTATKVSRNLDNTAFDTPTRSRVINFYSTIAMAKMTQTFYCCRTDQSSTTSI